MSSPSGVKPDMEGTVTWVEAARADYRRPDDHRQNDMSDEEQALSGVSVEGASARVAALSSWGSVRACREDGSVP